MGAAIEGSLRRGTPLRLLAPTTIITKLWVTSPGKGIVRAETQKGNTVLSQAQATWKA